MDPSSPSSTKSPKTPALLGQRLKPEKPLVHSCGPWWPQGRSRKTLQKASVFTGWEMGKGKWKQSRSAFFPGGRRGLREYSCVLVITTKTSITSSSISGCLASSQSAQGSQHSWCFITPSACVQSFLTTLWILRNTSTCELRNAGRLKCRPKSFSFLF